MSEAWKHFIKRDNAAECKICNKVVVHRGGSTSGLIRHLLHVHNIKLNRPKPKSSPSDRNSRGVNKKSPNTIRRFISTQTMPQIISKLAAVDGLSVRMITRSSFIRESFANKNMRLPKYESDVKNQILNYYKSVKEGIISDIRLEVSRNGRFTLILDEWTNVALRRFLNICIHGNDSFYNLGLVYISEKCNAAIIRTMIEGRLQEFGLSFERHIVATISDGPNVMKRLVLESPVEGFSVGTMPYILLYLM